MFALFYSLYVAMFTGNWQLYTFGEIHAQLGEPLNIVGTFLTSIFGDNQMTNLGSLAGGSPSRIIVLASLVLALITSIGIVVMAVKGVKKAFGIFFMGIR